MKKFVSILCVLVLGMGLMACGKPNPELDLNFPASSKADWEYIKERTGFIVGFDQNFAPMGFKTKDGFTGFDIEVAREVAKNLNVQIRLCPINWDNKDSELLTKKVDLLWNGFSITDTRKKAFNFSLPYLQNTQAIVVKNDSVYTTKEELVGKTFSVQKASSAIAAAIASGLAESESDKKMIQVSDNMTAISELSSGKVEFAVMDEVVARYYSANGNYKGKIRVLSVNLGDEQYGIGMRKGDDVFTQKINESLVALKVNGTLDRITKQFFGEEKQNLIPTTMPVA